MHVLRCKIGNVEIMDDHIMFNLIKKSYKRLYRRTCVINKLHKVQSNN